MKNSYFFAVLVSVFVFIFINYQLTLKNFVKQKERTKLRILKNIIPRPSIKLDANEYTEKCLNLYKKLRYPNKSLIIKPPLKEPPIDMLNDFTQNGEMPITLYRYINEAYSDADSNNKSLMQGTISKDFNGWLEKVRNNSELNYGDKELNRLMHEYSSLIKNKSFVVIGTQEPWIEAVAYDIGSSKITTLDYTRKNYQELPTLEWLHVNDYLEDAIQNKKLEHFDNIASFSSIEHSGLGRYGDPLSPNGDIEAVEQIHCMLKPGGLFF